MRCRPLIPLLLLVSAGCGGNDAPDDAAGPAAGNESPRVAAAEDAIAGAHASTIHPMTMSDAEVRKVVGEGPYCAFRYTSSGKPVLAWQRASGDAPSVAVVKLNGSLVSLTTGATAGATRFATGKVRLTLTPRVPDSTSASDSRLKFEVEDTLRAGYAGYVACLPLRGAGPSG